MKNPILLILISTLPGSMLAQSKEYGSFKILGTEIIYQKVFTADSLSSEKLVEFLKSAEAVGNVEVKGDKITASLSELVVDYKKFQFSQVATPPIIQTGKFSGMIEIELKDNRYRVTINGFLLKGNMGYKTINENESMTNYACLNSGTILSREWCKPTMLGLLEKALTDRLTYEAPKSSSDW